MPAISHPQQVESAPRTSIIMPVYRTGERVVDSIRSVLAQTDPDFELLVMIDASPDDSASRISDFLEQNPDSRVRVFNNEVNRGVAAVRNQGLDEAHGSWICFLDSDDKLRPTFLETLHTYAGESGADIAVGAHALVDRSGGSTVRVRAKPGLYTGEEAALALLEDRFTPYVWDKLFAAKLFEDLRYPEDIHRAEDAVAVLGATARADFVVVCDRPIYDYTVEAEGLTWGRVTPVAESVRLMEYMEAVARTLPASPRAKRAYAVSWVVTFLNNAQQALLVDGEEAAAVIEQCRRKISWGQLASTTGVQPVFAAAGALLKISPALYRKLYGAYVRRTYGIGAQS